MLKRKKQDISQIATSVVAQVTTRGQGEASFDKTQSAKTDGRNPAVLAQRPLGGIMGARAGTEKLSPRDRRRIARETAEAKWAQS
jgi:hypothetical protein